MAVSLPPDALPVEINLFRNPASIWAVEVARDGMSEERHSFYVMEKQLSKQLKDSSSKEYVTNRSIDEMVAVRDISDSRRWNRGKIENVLHLLGGTRYKVLRIDYGTSVRAKPEHVRDLPLNFQSLPPQALLLVLGGIVPVTLGISPDYNAMHPEVCEYWRPPALKFVHEVSQNYREAYFVESKNYPRNGQTRFGDLLLLLNDCDKLLSLSEMLCSHGHAKYSEEDFHRVQVADTKDSDGPELCQSLPSATCDVFRNDVPLAGVVPNSHSETKTRQTLSEYLEQGRKKLQESNKSISPEVCKPIADSPSQVCKPATDSPSEVCKPVTDSPSEVCKPETDTSSSEAPESSNGKIKSKLINLAKLKRTSTGNASTLESHDCHDSPVPVPTPKPKALDNRFLPAGATPKALDHRFLPAGRSVSSAETKKPISKNYWSGETSRSSLTSSDSESGIWSRSKLIHHGAKELPKTSDSSSNECKVKNIVQHQASNVSQQSSKNSQPLNSGGSDTRDTLDSSDGNTSSDTAMRKLTNRSAHLSRLICQTPRDKKTAELNLTPDNDHQGNFGLKLCTASNDRKDVPSNIKKGHILRSIDDDGSKASDFLARSVLLHGGFPPIPWMGHNDLKSKFSAHVEQYLIDRRWFHRILTIEKFMWPAIQKRQNVVMVSPRKSGKTSSYVVPLMDFMIDVEENPRGNGPLVLILCAGSKHVQHVYRECVKVVNGWKKAPRIECAYGLAISEQLLVRMMNGCEVFITTPACFLRICKERKYSFALNLKRLSHLVLDQANILLTRFLEEIRDIQVKLKEEQSARNDSKVERNPIQVVVSSERWEPQLLSFSKFIGNPLLCINDCFEACVYGKPEVAIHMTSQLQKPMKLLKVLKSLVGLHKIVVFCDAEEVDDLKKLLENQCMMTLVPSPDMSRSQLEGILHSWDTSRAGEHYILLCTDEEFDSIQRRDATIVVHYSLPSKDKTYFVKRLSAILDSLKNLMDERPQTVASEIHLLIDDSNSDQFPVLVQLMQRISKKLDSRLIEAAEVVAKEKEKSTKRQKIFCKNLKMYGECRETNCPNRHVFISNLDESDELPRSAIVRLDVMHVHSATHFSARIVQYQLEDNTYVTPCSLYVKLACKMSAHFSDPDSRVLMGEVNVGDICAVQTVEGMYQRVQVLEVVETNKYGNPILVLVKFIDEGKEQTLKVFMLQSLPEDLQNFPAQVVDVFLCGLLPADQDDDFGFDAISCVRNWFKKSDVLEDGKQKHLQGKVMLSMKGSLWIEPGNLMKWLPNIESFVVDHNIKEGLLSKKYALENCDHLTKLFKICGKKTLDLPGNQVPKCTRNKTKVLKPYWAFLEPDQLEDVEFICAEDSSQIYVRKTKFEELLHKLTDDISKEVSKLKVVDSSSLEVKDYCLVQYDPEDPKWFRAQILSKRDGIVKVFFVDYGDQKDVTPKELRVIPDWAIERLPFQAIECSLAGISTCESVDKIYDLTDDGAKNLLAKVCERKEVALLTGGKHYLVVLIDVSKPNPSILNKSLLEFDGFKPCEDQMEYLNIDLDTYLDSRENLLESDPVEDDEDTNTPACDMDVADLEFKDDESDDGGFEVCNVEDLMKSIQEANPGFKESIADFVKAQCNLAPGEENPPIKSNLRGNEKVIIQKNDSSYKKCVENDISSPSSKPLENGDSDWEEEQENVGRLNLPMLCVARPPRTKWYEDLYYVCIKISVSGVENYFLQCTCDTIQFSTTVGGKIYHLNHQLRGIIFPDSVKSSVKGPIVEVKMKKACGGVNWGRLFAVRRRFPWLMWDHDAACMDSSDSDGPDCLQKINKEIRKLPLKQRRRYPKKEWKDKLIGPDLGSDSGGSNSECGAIDSDEAF